MPPTPHDDHGLARRFAVLRYGPTGFRCRSCGHDRGYWVSPHRRPRMQECRRCHKQQSVTAGTALHGTRLALHIWVDRAERFDAADIPSASSLAREYGIARSTAWHLQQRLLAATQEHAHLPDNRFVAQLRHLALRCRRPQRSPPLGPDAPSEVRRLRRRFAGRKRGLRTEVVLRVTPHVATTHTVCLPREQRLEVKGRRGLYRYQPALVRWLTAMIEQTYRTVSLRWLSRYIGHLLLLWNDKHDPYRPRQRTSGLERLLFAPNQPLTTLRPWA